MDVMKREVQGCKNEANANATDTMMCMSLNINDSASRKPWEGSQMSVMSRQQYSLTVTYPGVPGKNLNLRV
jgi:hypothetical protein